MWPALVSILPGLLDKIIPDPSAAADAKLKALEMAQRGELATLDADMRLMLAQAEINKIEAGTDIYRGGWRPGAGWVCVFGLAYNFVIRPLVPWCFQAAGVTVPDLPAIDVEELMALLAGLLGLGSLRTYERLKGKA